MTKFRLNETDTKIIAYRKLDYSHQEIARILAKTKRFIDMRVQQLIGKEYIQPRPKGFITRPALGVVSLKSLLADEINQTIIKMVREEYSVAAIAQEVHRTNGCIRKRKVKLIKYGGPEMFEQKKL